MFIKKMGHVISHKVTLFWGHYKTELSLQNMNSNLCLGQLHVVPVTVFEALLHCRV